MCASPIRSENFASLVNARKSSNEQCGTGKPCLCFFAIRISNVAEFNLVLQFLKRDNCYDDPNRTQDKKLRAATKRFWVDHFVIPRLAGRRPVVYELDLRHLRLVSCIVRMACRAQTACITQRSS